MMPSGILERLPNGLKVVFVPDDHVESVCFGILVASGSRHESAEDAGISHFIEHMLFKGTQRRTALEISRAIEGRGGNFNAFTSEEATCFYAHVPYDALATAFDVLTDMYLNAAIPEEEFARERGVVIEEIKMYADEPDAVASENLSRSLFPGNALGLPISGTAETLLKMTPEHMRAYLRRAYVPAATTVVVAGRFDPAAVIRMISDTLGRMPEGKPLPETRINPRRRPVKEVVVRREIHQAQLALGYRIFGAHAPLRKRYAANLFDCMMGRSMSSRLFQSIREKRGLSYDIHSQIQFFKETGGWAVTAGVDAKRADEAVAAIDAELKRVRSKRPGSAELRRTKDYLIGNFRIGMESQRARMMYFGSRVHTFGEIIDPERIVESIDAVTPDDVLAIANEILQDRNRAVSWVLPKG